MNKMNRCLDLALLLATCSLALLQVASLPVWEEDKLPVVDLRKTGCVMPIQDEGLCDASYAHVAVALSAYQQCQSKKSSADAQGSLEHYHARFVTDCGTESSEHIAGCRGGFVSSSIDFIRENGLPFFEDYESAKSKTGAGSDSDQCPVPIPGKISGVQNWQLKLQPVDSLQKVKLVRLKFEQVYDHLIKHGPVVANLQLWPDYETYDGKKVFESFYGNEIFDFRTALVVGFDYNEQSRAYFTLWNSMGTQWGDQGYLKIFEYTLWMHHVNFYGFVNADAE